jgi:glutathione S-transferase
MLGVAVIPNPQDDAGFVLFESAAIARYVAAKARSPLLPHGDLHSTARFEQAMSMEAAQFEAAFEPIIKERVSKPLRTGGAPDEERVAALEKTLESRLVAYEKILAKQRYLAGDALTLADLFHLPFGTYAAPQGFNWFEDAATYPNIARYVLSPLRPELVLTLCRWWADISSRPAWVEVQRLVRESTPLYEASLKPHVQVNV